MTFLVMWAHQHGRLPSEVAAQFRRNPKDFQLLYAAGVYRAEKEKEEMDKQKKAAEAQK